MISVAADKHPEKPIRAFFLDSENGAGKLLEGMEFLTRSDTVVVFHRDNFPADLKNKLELGPASIEWVKCVDRGVKNSMDVQIIAELAMRLAEEGFQSAYIVSEDKGFLPAVHYLQQAPKGRGRDIALVKNVVQATMRTVFGFLTDLKRAKRVEDVEDALAPLYGEGEARCIIEELERIFLKASFDDDVVQDDEAAVAQVPEREAKPVSFVELPGIGRALAGKLEQAGIASPAELERIGAAEAWRRIHHSDASFPPKWVYSFEAAIQGISVHALDAEVKRRLKSDVKAFVLEKEHAA